MRFTVQVPDEIYRSLSRMAAAKNVSLSALARQIITEKIEGQKSFEEEARRILSVIEQKLDGKSNQEGMNQE